MLDLMRRLWLTLMAVVALLAGSCGSDEEPTATGTSSIATTTTVAASTSTPPTTTAPATTTAASTTATAPSTTAAVATEGGDVNVYWSWSIPTIVSGTPERLGAGGRPEAETDAVGAAIEALLAGPDDVESEIGMGTEIPPGTRLESWEHIATTAVIGLSSAFETPSGTLSEVMRVAQVVFTATQFDEIDTVRFRIDGADVDVLGSHGLEVGDGLDRDDFADVRPFILVESPTPGAVVDSPLAITGESNTFEATVEYAVTDAEGLIVAEGITTALGGNGTWGPFEIITDLPPDLEGTGAVIVFNTSAVDGTQIDVVEYPIRFQSEDQP